MWGPWVYHYIIHTQNSDQTPPQTKKVSPLRSSTILQNLRNTLSFSPKFRSPRVPNSASQSRSLSKPYPCQSFIVLAMLKFSPTAANQIRFLLQSLNDANSDSVLRELTQVLPFVPAFLKFTLFCDSLFGALKILYLVLEFWNLDEVQFIRFRFWTFSDY